MIIHVWHDGRRVGSAEQLDLIAERAPNDGDAVWRWELPQGSHPWAHAELHWRSLSHPMNRPICDVERPGRVIKAKLLRRWRLRNTSIAKLLKAVITNARASNLWMAPRSS